MSKVRFLLLSLILTVFASCSSLKEGERQSIKTTSNYNMVLVKGGTITMGTDENSQNELKLEDFYIGETEVTQALWQEIMGNNRSQLKGNDLPVENVSWNDCQVFVQKLNAKTGQKFRLPTEAEWEFAARSKNYKSCAFLDDEMLNTMIQSLNNNENNKEGIKPHNVMQGEANEKGLFGMEDNVWEWCFDSECGIMNNNEIGSEEFKVIKGIVTNNNTPETKYIIRYPFHCRSISSLLGFRLVLDK